MDYMDWRGDVPFSGSPFNEIDNIILSIACMADFSGIVPENFEEEPVGLIAGIRIQPLYKVLFTGLFSPVLLKSNLQHIVN